MKRRRKKLIDKLLSRINEYDILYYGDIEIQFEVDYYRITQTFREGSVWRSTCTLNPCSPYLCCLNIKSLQAINDCVYNKIPLVVRKK